MNLRAFLDSLPDEALLPVSWVKAKLAAAGEEMTAGGPVGEPVFTVRSLAAHLHRSTSTVRGWCERGEIEATLVKSRWFIKREAVERFLDGPKPRAEEARGQTINAAANRGAGPRRARPSDAAGVDLSDWRKVRGKS